MANYTWRDSLPKELCGADVLWGSERDEELSHGDPVDAADEALDFAYDPEKPELPADWKFEARAYRRTPVSEQWIHAEAARLVEKYEEDWAAEFGGPDGDGKTGSAMAAAESLVRGWAEASVPWRCEPTGDAVVYDADWVRAEYPDVPIALGKKEE